MEAVLKLTQAFYLNFRVFNLALFRSEMNSVTPQLFCIYLISNSSSNCIRNVKELSILKDFRPNTLLKAVAPNDKMAGLNNSRILFPGRCSAEKSGQAVQSTTTIKSDVLKILP